MLWNVYVKDLTMRNIPNVSYTDDIFVFEVTVIEISSKTMLKNLKKRLRYKIAVGEGGKQSKRCSEKQSLTKIFLGSTTKIAELKRMLYLGVVMDEKIRNRRRTEMNFRKWLLEQNFLLH